MRLITIFSTMAYFVSDVVVFQEKDVILIFPREVNVKPGSPFNLSCDHITGETRCILQLHHVDKDVAVYKHTGYLALA